MGRLKADLSLLIITVIWGASFILMKQSTDYISPFTFLAYRYLLASIVLCVLLPGSLKRINPKTLKYGFIIGLTMFGGCAFQILGLRFTSASKSGFITGLSVILVPLFLTIKYKKFPAIAAILGIFISFTGLALLTIGPSFDINIGDILTFFCAVFFALQIILISKYSAGLDPIALANMAMLTVSILSFVPGIIYENLYTVINWQSMTGLVFTALFCSSLAYSVQISVQKYTTPIHAALIFMGEPVFSMFFAYVLGGEILTVRGIVGCSLVLLGMLISEIRLKPAVSG